MNLHGLTPSFLVLTSLPVVAGIALVVSLIRRWAKLGSTLWGAFCGILIGSGAFGNKIANWAETSVTTAGAALNGWTDPIPALSKIPAWGWNIIVVSLAVTLAATVVALLDGAKRVQAQPTVAPGQQVTL